MLVTSPSPSPGASPDQPQQSALDLLFERHPRGCTQVYIYLMGGSCFKLFELDGSSMAQNNFVPQVVPEQQGAHCK